MIRTAVAKGLLGLACLVLLPLGAHAGVIVDGKPAGVGVCSSAQDASYQGPSGREETATVVPDQKKSGVTLDLERVSGSTYRIVVTNEKKRFVSVLVADASTGQVLTPDGYACSFGYGEIVNPRGLVGSGGIFPPNVQPLLTEVPVMLL